MVFKPLKPQSRSPSEFQTEYAKSGRSLCNKCKEKIAKDHLRFGINVDHDEVITFFLDYILNDIYKEIFFQVHGFLLTVVPYGMFFQKWSIFQKLFKQDFTDKH